MSHRTRDDDGRRLPEPKKKKRAKRANLIGNSEHRNVYYRLMQAGWSSTSLAFYAAHYYGETISASTFRSYRSKRGWPARNNPANHRDSQSETIPAGWDPSADLDNPIDVLHERAQLVHLQKLRIALAVGKEVRTGELEPGTRLEIQALDKLLVGVKEDLQMLGMLPGAVVGDGEQDVGAVRDGPTGGVNEDGPRPVDSGPGRSFGELVGGLNPETEAAFARQLQQFGLLDHGQHGNGHVNGQVVDGG
jgi:hypothetical protein